MNQAYYARFESCGAHAEQKIHAVFRICFDRELMGLPESPGKRDTRRLLDAPEVAFWCNGYCKGISFLNKSLHRSCRGSDCQWGKRGEFQFESDASTAIP